MRGVRVPLHEQEDLHVEHVFVHYMVFSSEGPWGQGTLDSKNLVVFIHGLGGQADQITWGAGGGLAQRLVNAGYTVLALDLLGHGHSDSPDVEVGPDEFLAQIVSLLQRLDLSEPFHMIGFSMGCLIAAMYAAKFPSLVKGLVLDSPFSCHLPLHTVQPVAVLYGALIQAFFGGGNCHSRALYNTVLHLDGRRWEPALVSLNNSALPVSVMACSPMLSNAWSVHRAVRRSHLFVVPFGIGASWARGSSEIQRSVRDQILSLLGKFDEQSHTQ